MDFALKEFKDRPLRVGADFNKELSFLDELRKSPNDRIVTHLATWTQDGRYYMLFPYAQCNLRQYMERKAFGSPRVESTLWLLYQVHGLVNALRHIHNLPNAESQPSSDTSSAAPVPNLQTSGWHHDIKPENILYFGTLTSPGGDFHIADFGSGKVHTYRSGSVNTKSPNGTLTYEPPEVAKEGFTSRPYDVWSMGCVLLELLIWALYDHKSVQSFASDRQARRFPGSHTDIVSDDAYWQMAQNGEITLRSSVLEWIRRLKHRLQEQKLQSLESVLEVVERMLDTDRRTRISALSLFDIVNEIYSQAEIDPGRSSND